jgi:guanylate kinase
MIYVITGQTSSGKTTLAKMLERKLKLKRIVNHTSRPPREGEIDGVDYHFTTEDKIHELNLICKNTFQTAYGPWTYGVDVGQIDHGTDYIIVLEASGALEMQNSELETRVVYVIAPEPLRRERAYKRESKKFDPEIERRFESDAKDFDGFEEEADYVVLNINKKDAFKQIENYIEQERWKYWCRL